MHVHRGREDDVVALAAHLVADDRRVALGGLLVEARRERHRRRHAGRLALARADGAVAEVDRRQPDALDAVARPGVRALAARHAGQLVAGQQADALGGRQRLDQQLGARLGRSRVSHHGRCAGSPQRPAPWAAGATARASRAAIGTARRRTRPRTLTDRTGPTRRNPVHPPPRRGTVCGRIRGMATVSSAPSRPSAPLPSKRIGVSHIQALAARVRHRRRARAGRDRPALHRRSSLGTVPKSTPEDVEAAIERARAAQRSWSTTSFAERKRWLLRYHDIVLARQDEILDLVQLEAGKARRHALEEVLDAAIVARYYANTAERHLTTHRRRGALPFLTKAHELRHPARRRGDHRAVELPARADVLGRRPRAHGRQRRRPQARLADPVHRAVGRRRDGGRRPAEGPAADRHRLGLRARPAPHRQQRLHHVHRLHRDGPQRRRAGRAQPHRRVDGARRQERDDRPRGREPRQGRRGRRARAVLQRRPALHLDRAAVRAREGRRRVHRRSSSSA